MQIETVRVPGRMSRSAAASSGSERAFVARTLDDRARDDDGVRLRQGALVALRAHPVADRRRDLAPSEPDDLHVVEGPLGLVPCGTEGHRRDRHVEADDRRDGKHDDAMGHGGGGRHGLILAMIAISAIVDRLGPLLRRPTAWRRARPPLPPRRFRHQRDTTTRAQQKDTA